jgi:hypothetical protein
LDGKMLAKMKSTAPDDPGKRALIDSVTSAADRAMHEGPISVVQKTILPPSGDKHDYMS